MANVTKLQLKTDGGAFVNVKVPTLVVDQDFVYPATGGTLAIISSAQTFATGQIFTGPLNVNIVGASSPTALSNLGLQSYGNSSDYIQNNLQNLNSAGSADWTLTTDTGNDSTGYATFGINNSAWTNVNWTINGPMDAYLSCAGGSIAIGSDTAGKAVALYCGGTLAANIKFKATDTYVAAFRATVPVGIGGVMWSKITSTALASWTTAATCLGAASTGVTPDGSTPTLTLPANFFVVGRTLKLRAIGRLTTHSVVPNMTVAFKLGSTTVLTTGAQSMQDGSATHDWVLEIDLLCVAVGSSATIKARGRFITQNTAAAYDWLYLMSQTTPANIDTSITQVIDVTVACSSSNANNTFTNYATWIEIAG